MHLQFISLSGEFLIIDLGKINYSAVNHFLLCYYLGRGLSTQEKKGSSRKQRTSSEICNSHDKKIYKRSSFSCSGPKQSVIPSRPSLFLLIDQAAPALPEILLLLLLQLFFWQGRKQKLLKQGSLKNVAKWIPPRRHSRTAQLV